MIRSFHGFAWTTWEKNDNRNPRETLLSLLAWKTKKKWNHPMKYLAHGGFATSNMLMK